MDRYITLGVAGHVDHGKTSLVKRLTGVDTDRMQEEKQRGVSIEAGIAPWIMDAGLNLALVDVPGHKDFLKNTVRGLSCVDLAILVVAADDGVMPQTLEHLETLHYFGAKGGFVVLSKADLVDDETLELAELEIRDLVQGTFLDGKDVIHFSALDQRGTESIRASAIKEAQIISSKTADGPFRLWIDQARHVNGFGTVVSGTIISGCLNKDDRLQLLPSGMITRSRFLESHGLRIEKAVAGQRVGINLHNMAMDQVGRGMLIASPDSSSVSYLINAELDVRGKQPVSLTNRMRVKLYIGTLVVNAMVVIMGGERISPGQSGRVQFRLSRPVPVHPKDRFAVSLMNVNSIVGGGYVLEIPLEKYTNARSGKMEPVLAALKNDDVASFVRKAVEMAVHRPVTAGLLQQRSGIDLHRIQSELDRMLTNGVVMDFRDKGYFLADYFIAGKENVLTAAKEAIEKGRLKIRINAQEIVDTMGSLLTEDLVHPMLDELCREGKLVKEGGGFKIPDRKLTLSADDERLSRTLLEFAEQSGFVPFSASRFCSETPGHWNEDKAKRMLHFLHNQNKLIRLSNKRFVSINVMDTIKQRVQHRIESHGTVCLSDSQDILGYGRTMAVPVFEYLDSVGFTRREGEGRVLVQCC